MGKAAGGQGALGHGERVEEIKSYAKKGAQMGRGEGMGG